MAGVSSSVIQLSVPSSVMASGIITRIITMNSGLPSERDHRP